MVLFLQKVKSTAFKKASSIILVGIFTFFSASFRRKVSEFASSCGPISSAYLNIGTGFSGLGSNLFAIIFTFFFPSYLFETRVQNLKYKITALLILFNFVFFIYIYIFYLFMRRYGHFVFLLDCKNKIINQTETKNSFFTETNTEFTQSKMNIEKKKTSLATLKIVGTQQRRSTFSIFKRSIDIMCGILFTYVITLEVVCFMIPVFFKMFDHSHESLLLTYFLLYNLGDTLGKMLPHSYNFTSSSLLHFVTFLRVLLQIYFMFALYTEIPVVLKHFALRSVLYFFVGLSNGYLTNNYFAFSESRFIHPKNKAKSEFLIQFSLGLGITFGTFIAVLWSL